MKLFSGLINLDKDSVFLSVGSSKMNMPPERPFDTINFLVCEKDAKKNGGSKKGCLNYSGFQGNASVTRG